MHELIGKQAQFIPKQIWNKTIYKNLVRTSDQTGSAYLIEIRI